MKVVCVNDKNLPTGSEITEGGEYTVANKFVNWCEQVVYILDGVNNNGTTEMGMPWEGYRGERFKVLNGVAEMMEEESAMAVDYGMN